MNKQYKLTGFADEIADGLTEQIEALNQLGMRYVEMRGVDGKNLIYHDDNKVGEIKARLNDTGIALSALGSPLGKIGIDDDFEAHFEAFKRAVEIAHRMGTKNIRLFSFYVAPGRRQSMRDRVFERMERFAEYAKANGVVLLHENEKGIYGESAAECLELMEAFGGEHFRAIFDFANFVQVGQDTAEAYELLKDYIAYVHVKDARREDGAVVPAGYGDGNVGPILKRMLDGGFDGFLSLEPHLFEFRGFALLERGAAGMGERTTDVLSGFQAFALAKRSLEALVG